MVLGLVKHFLLVYLYDTVKGIHRPNTGIESCRNLTLLVLTREYIHVNHLSLHKTCITNNTNTILLGRIYVAEAESGSLGQRV